MYANEQRWGGQAIKTTHPSTQAPSWFETSLSKIARTGVPKGDKHARDNDNQQETHR
jgi:hypothetical protein